MKWTTRKPDRAGWWLYRESLKTKPRFVEVTQGERGLVPQWSGYWSSEAIDVENFTIEWISGDDGLALVNLGERKVIATAANT